MSPTRRAPQINYWKVSTIVMAAALAIVIGTDRVASAEAAGPVRLSKALAALKSGKKLLEEAKEPPAPYHAQSLALVSQAISAVEREIKVYEANKEKSKDKLSDKGAEKGKPKTDAKAAKKKDAPAKKPARVEADSDEE